MNLIGIANYQTAAVINTKTFSGDHIVGNLNADVFAAQQMSVIGFGQQAHRLLSKLLNSQIELSQDAYQHGCQIEAVVVQIEH